MFAVFVVLLLILVIAVAVVLIVALPQLRSGNEIFTEDGKQAVARAGQVARTGPIAVVGGTKNLIAGTSQKLRPASPTIVGQRGVPADSGPIPEVAQEEARIDVVPPRPDVVIDLREPAPGTKPIMTTPAATGKAKADRQSVDPE